MNAEQLAAEMYAECRDFEQSARLVQSDELAAAVRESLRTMARADDLRIRTARVDDTVVAVRLDAEIWTQTTDVMRQKLTPP